MLCLMDQTLIDFNFNTLKCAYRHVESIVVPLSIGGEKQNPAVVVGSKKLLR